jgi:hypothetical protein
MRLRLARHRPDGDHRRIQEASDNVPLRNLLLIGYTGKPTNEMRPLPLLSPSMESPKRKRISDIKAGVLMIDQVKPAVLEGTVVRFDLSKGKGIK